MRHLRLESVLSGFKTGILIVAVCLQMLPFFFFLVVVGHALGAASAVLVVFPLFFIAAVFGLCRLTSQQASHRYDWPPPGSWRTTLMPVRNHDALIKTRAERYQDLKEALVGDKP